MQENIQVPQEAGLEIPDHLDVSKIMKEKNAFFVHMIQVTKDLDVSENNKSIDTSRLSVADKLDMVYGKNPSLSASTLRPRTADGTFRGVFGALFSHGEVKSAHQGDAGTKALSSKERYVIGGNRNSVEDIDEAIDRVHVFENQKSYNEIVLDNPEVAGGFMKLEPFTEHISYKEEEREYYDGEKQVSKIGVLDLSNPKDRFGRPTGANFDIPLATLLEMEKRGKVFVMDEANQMYIVRSIDEKSRKVEFETIPTTPADFAFYYGREKMNPYTKKEIADRLEKSLQEKGIKLH